MQTLFDLTLGTIKADPDEPVCMLAIDFWSTMAEEEAELLDEIDAANEQGAHAPPLPGYVRAALPHLVPVLLEETLTKQARARGIQTVIGIQMGRHFAQ